MEKYKINWVAGLKGSAAMLVFIHHFFLLFYPAFCNGSIDASKTSTFIDYKISKTPFNILGWGGSFAVSLFFIISGFLVAYSYYVKSDRKIKAKSVIGRYFKLMFPILFSSLVVFFIVKTNLFRTSSLVEGYKSIGLGNHYGSFKLGLLDVVGECIYGVFASGGAYINAPLWTMQCELFFSVILMLYLSVFGNNKKRAWLYAITLVFSFNSYYFCFIAGCIICDILYNKKEWFDKINKWDFKLILLISGLYFASFTYVAKGNLYIFFRNVENLDINMVYHNIGGVLIFLFFVLSKTGQKILSLKPFVKLGDLSFVIYAFHWVLIHSMSMFIVYKLFPYMKYIYACLISLGITSVVLFAMCIYFDGYIKRWTSFLTKKITNDLLKMED